MPVKKWMKDILETVKDMSPDEALNLALKAGLAKKRKPPTTKKRKTKK